MLPSAPVGCNDSVGGAAPRSLVAPSAIEQDVPTKVNEDHPEDWHECRHGTSAPIVLPRIEHDAGDSRAERSDAVEDDHHAEQLSQVVLSRGTMHPFNAPAQ